MRRSAAVCGGLRLCAAWRKAHLRPARELLLVHPRALVEDDHELRRSVRARWSREGLVTQLIRGRPLRRCVRVRQRVHPPPPAPPTGTRRHPRHPRHPRHHACTCSSACGTALVAGL